MTGLVRAGLARRRLSTVVVALVVLGATAMLVLGIGLTAAADGPFDRSFAAQRGAHATVYYDPGAVSAERLRATAGRPGVSAAAGPYRTAGVEFVFAADRAIHLPPVVVAGRDAPDAPVDVLHLDRGRWATAPGEIVLSREAGAPLGERIVAGDTTLTVVGVADSVTQTAGAWVVPAQIPGLAATGTAGLQMLYRFAGAADVTAGIATVTAGLPAAAVVGTTSYLTVRQANDRSAAAATPFVVAFAILGMIVSVLIVANVVGGAVLAGYRNIGVLKAIGCTPAQVVGVYAGRLLAPAAAGGAAGLVLGNLLALPVLQQAAEAYQVAEVAVPVWANVVALGTLVLVVGAAAVAPALRAGRMSATAVLTLGRQSRPRRGQFARRLLARVPLPRPVALGLGTPFARPARAAGGLVAVLLGTVTVVLATGLGLSLGRVAEGVNRYREAPVRVELQGTDPAPTAALLRGLPGTAHLTAVRDTSASVTGLAGSVPVTGYDGDTGWLGYRLISGRWYASAGEAVVPSNLLAAAGRKVGDTLTLAVGDRHRTVRVVGEVFDVDDAGLRIRTDASVVAALDPGAPAEQFEVALDPGTDASGYAAQANQRLAGSGIAYVEGALDDTITLFLGLIVMLVLVVVGIAGFGVFNTALLDTREQVRDIGILKAVGMTPRQVRVLVVSSLAGMGVLAGLAAVPLGVALHREVLAAMARAAATGLPRDFVHVFPAGALATLAAAGLVLAVAGALIPAGWAARSRPAVALRAE